nr:copia protein [Tanacetum cinerariifolium]
MSPENKTHYESEKKSIHLILTGIGDEIYSTVDTCKIAQEMWEAIERLQQGESLNIQDVKTNFFWEFKEFTSHNGETMESYYTRKPKRVKDSMYHKEKMLLCKQAEQGVPLQVEQSDWLADTDEEIDEQELEAHYNYMAKIQEFPIADSGTTSKPLEQVQYNDEYNVFANVNHHCEHSESTSNTCFMEKDDSDVTLDSSDMCENDIQIDQNAEDERVALADLIANLKLNVDENKKIQKQLKKENTSLAHELEQCKSILVETSKTLKESNSVFDSTSSVNKSSSLTDNSKLRDTPPITNIQSSTKPTNLTNAHAEENNDNQAEHEFTNSFCTRYKKVLSLPYTTLEEVYVAQPDGFVNPDHPKKVYRLRKALYGLKQAPRAWYDELLQFLMSKGFTKEAEYVVLSASCAQVMWMRTQLNDYGFNYNKIPLYYDSQLAISISCNPVQHSRTKHIHTRTEVLANESA